MSVNSHFPKYSTYLMTSIKLHINLTTNCICHEIIVLFVFENRVFKKIKWISTFEQIADFYNSPNNK